MAANVTKSCERQLVEVESESTMYLTMTHFAVRQIDLKFKPRLIFFLIISAFFLLLHCSLFSEFRRRKFLRVCFV